MADNVNQSQEEPSKSSLKKIEKQAKMAASKAEKAAKQTVAVVGGKKDASGSKELIGITASKATEFSSWYLEVILKSGMIEYYNEVRR